MMMFEAGRKPIYIVSKAVELHSFPHKGRRGQLSRRYGHRPYMSR